MIRHSYIFSTLTLVILSSLGDIGSCFAQERSSRSDKVYFRSGFGLSVPVGTSREYLKPKFSTSLGGLFFLNSKNTFLYPKIGLNAYGYDQLNVDPGTDNRIVHGRSTTYLLSMNYGYRKTIARLGFYGFAGGGGGVILVPKVSMPDTEIVRMYNKSNLMALLEAGFGADYSFGNILLFAEGSYTHGLNNLEQQRYQAIPLSFGVRTNITKIFYRRQN